MRRRPPAEADTLRIRGLSFDWPEPVDGAYLCPCEGVYAILSQGELGRFRILYFGETGNLHQRIGPSHHKWNCWLSHTDDPWIAFYPLPGSTAAERREIEQELRDRADWDPPCNG